MFPKIKFKINTAFSVLLLGLLVSSCMGKKGIQAIFQQRTPYESYEHRLKEAKLHKTSLGNAWINAGQEALQDSALVNLPFRETGYFTAEKPRAASFGFKAKEGELIDVRVTTRSKNDMGVFLDLFKIENTNPREIKHLAAADTLEIKIQYKVEEPLQYLLRLQPELLTSGSYTITIESKPSLVFPVQGKGNSAVQSFWGADRDGGSRKHEGVDIFAPRGTPVIASTRGRINRVNETPIGGKVVWLSDLNSNQNIYYAHLDSQVVQAGQEVKPGDVLGFVGNTGNAKSTVPHLHYGIYKFGRGAVDPYPYIYQSDKKPASLRVLENQIGQINRVAKKNVLMRIAPDSKGFVLNTLAKHTAVEIVGGTADWFRVLLADGQSGFIQKDGLENINKPISTKQIKTDTELKEEPAANASPIALIKKNTSVSILGIFQEFNLVKLADGTLGWF